MVDILRKRVKMRPLETRSEQFLKACERRVKGLAPGREEGFTLTELLIIIAIIGILSALSWPSLTSYRITAKTNGAATDLLAVLQRARMKAITDNTTYSVTFNIANVTYTDSSTGMTYSFPEGIEYGYVGGSKNDEGVTIAGNTHFMPNSRVTFNPKGYVESTDIVGNVKGAGYVYIIPESDQIAGRKDRTRAIKIQQSTGSIKVLSCNAACAASGDWR